MNSYPVESWQTYRQTDRKWRTRAHHAICTGGLIKGTHTEIWDWSFQTHFGQSWINFKESGWKSCVNPPICGWKNSKENDILEYVISDQNCSQSKWWEVIYFKSWADCLWTVNKLFFYGRNMAKLDCELRICGHWSVSRRCPEPRQFFGDPALLARDNILLIQWKNFSVLYSAEPWTMINFLIFFKSEWSVSIGRASL